mmetsp:Transcript_23236/g.37174  ORF Transcript_23236/g.37174 Transcript_23236/m.37174 type:complete len:201 (+) Transcript_23236:140-742(+)
MYPQQALVVVKAWRFSGFTAFVISSEICTSYLETSCIYRTISPSLPFNALPLSLFKPRILTWSPLWKTTSPAGRKFSARKALVSPDMCKKASQRPFTGLNLSIVAPCPFRWVAFVNPTTVTCDPIERAGAECVLPSSSSVASLFNSSSFSNDANTSSTLNDDASGFGVYNPFVAFVHNSLLAAPRRSSAENLHSSRLRDM